MSILEDLKQQYRLGDFSVKIIMLTVLFFLLSIPFFYQFKLGFFIYPKWLGLSSKFEDCLFFPWTFFTYQFLHNGVFHLIINALVLVFSTRYFLIFFTEKQFLSVYILGGFFAGLIFVVGYFFIDQQQSILVGASASIMAVLMAVTVFKPLMYVRLPLIGQIKLWYITATVIIALDILNFRLENTGGHLSHLGGALFGFLYIKALKNGIDLGSGLNWTLDAISNLFSGKKATPFKTVHKNVKPQPQSTTTRVVTKDKTQQQIDEILDKISQSGYDSLTKDEKEFLFKAGK